jgi:hypothetical protein
MTDAEQWLIVAAVALLVVVSIGWVGLAVVLVARTIVSSGRRIVAWLPAGGLAERRTGVGRCDRPGSDPGETFPSGSVFGLD